VGVGVHKAARVGAVGHGGQVLVSNATRELVEDELPPDTRLRDLGAYELKDLERPEQLFQLEAEGLPREFPPLSARRVGRPHRARRMALLLAPVVAAVVVVGAIAIAWNNDTGAAVGSAPNPITIVSPWEGGEEKAFLEVLKGFQEKTGLRTQVEEAPAFESVVRRRIDAGNPPMIAMVPTSAMLADLAHEGNLQPLADLGIAESYLRENYSTVWLDHGSVDGTVYAFPAKASSKSVLWYRPDAFEAMGLTVPRTWAHLLAVTQRIKARGSAPWALEAGDSWPLTDWFENVYIRTAGPAWYSRLFAGKLRFDHPSVTAALRRMTTVLNDRYVAGGIAGALENTFGEGIGLVFRKNPGAFLYMEGGFVGGLALAYINPEPMPGTTIALAPFPAIDPRFGNPVIGGSNLAVAFVDNEAVRELLLYLSSPAAGSVWVSTGAVASPNKGVPPDAYPNVLGRAEARQLKGATVFVSDGSDLLPGELGDEWGSTLQEVIQRPADIPRLMNEFERKAARAFKR
jgi:alpha-glucoside transport system substrate-binding protein